MLQKKFKPNIYETLLDKKSNASLKSPVSKTAHNKLLISDSKIPRELIDQDADPELSKHISHIIQLKDSMGYINITLSNSIHALGNCVADMQQLIKREKTEPTEDISTICVALTSIKQVLEDAFVKNSQSLVATPIAKKSKKVIQTEKISNAFNHIKQTSRQKDMFFSDEGSNLMEEFSVAEDSKIAIM